MKSFRKWYFALTFLVLFIKHECIICIRCFRMCTTCEIGQVRGPYFRRFFPTFFFFIEFYHPDGDEWFASFFCFSRCASLSLEIVNSKSRKQRLTVDLRVFFSIQHENKNSRLFTKVLLLLLKADAWRRTLWRDVQTKQGKLVMVWWKTKLNTHRQTMFFLFTDG